MLGGTRFYGIYARDEAFTALLRGQPSRRERHSREGPSPISRARFAKVKRNSQLLLPLSVTRRYSPPSSQW